MQTNTNGHTPLSPREARDQAARFLGMLASVEIEVKSGNSTQTFEVPNPSLLDDVQQGRYDQLQLDLEDLDRGPDVTNGEGKFVRKGPVLDPHRKGGKLVEAYNIRLCKVLFGAEGYKQFIAGGGRSNDVGAIWWQMNKALAEAAKADSKSGAGDQPLASVSDRD